MGCWGSRAGCIVTVWYCIEESNTELARPQIPHAVDGGLKAWQYTSVERYLDCESSSPIRILLTWSCRTTCRVGEPNRYGSHKVRTIVSQESLECDAYTICALLWRVPAMVLQQKITRADRHGAVLSGAWRGRKGYAVDYCWVSQD